MNRKRSAIIIALLVLVAVALIILVVKLFMDDSASWGNIYEAAGVESGVTDNEKPASDEVKVTFLDVGQGDCILIEDSGKTALIDAGEYTAERAVLGYLAAEGVKRIDYLVVTHPHTDHMGSMEGVIEKYDVGQIIFTNVAEDMTPTNKTYYYLLKAIDERGVPVTTANVGDVFELGKGSFKVYAAGGYSDLNNCSLVLKYTVGETSFLLMGDAEFEVEDDISSRFGSELECDVLKVGHHATKYGTGNNILDAAKPDYAVIMCGYENEYGYPKEAVLNRLANAGAEILRTDLQGDIVFYSDGSGLRVETEKEAA